MLKKTITYKDLDGNQAEEDAYFNLTKAEAIELNIRNDLEVIGRGRNNNEIMDTFKRILSMSYGIRTGDGRFRKEGFAEFAASEAYSELFMEIWTKPEYAIEFIKSILPPEMIDQSTDSQANVPETLKDHPSMQGYKYPRAEVRSQARLDEGLRAPIREETIGEEAGWKPAVLKPGLENFNTTPYPQPPAIATDAEYQEFLAYKASREAAQTPPAPVSTTPEESQQSVPLPPRDELI